MRDEGGRSKGFGFVSYDNFESADLAIASMNGQWLMNKQITVQYALKKDSKSERHGSLAERILAANNPNARRGPPPGGPPMPFMGAPPGMPPPAFPPGGPMMGSSRFFFFAPFIFYVVLISLIANCPFFLSQALHMVDLLPCMADQWAARLATLAQDILLPVDGRIN